jgi:hypothetical protein
MSSFKVFSQGLCGKQKNPSNTNNKIKKGWHLSLIQTLTIVNHLYTHPVKSFNHQFLRAFPSGLTSAFLLVFSSPFHRAIIHPPPYTPTILSAGLTKYSNLSGLVLLLQFMEMRKTGAEVIIERDSYMASKDCMMS